MGEVGATQVDPGRVEATLFLKPFPKSLRSSLIWWKSGGKPAVTGTRWHHLSGRSFQGLIRCRRSLLACDTRLRLSSAAASIRVISMGGLENSILTMSTEPIR